MLQGHDPLPLSGFLLETCEEAELLERETKTAYKHRSLRPIILQSINLGINRNHGKDLKFHESGDWGWSQM